MIADDIYKALSPKDGLKDSFPTLFKQCAKVKVQNVSNYYYDNPKELWESEDFPNVAPPWPLVWMEWKTPSIWHSENPQGIAPTAQRYVKTKKLSDGTYEVYSPFIEHRGVMILAEEPEWGYQLGARWVLRCRYFSLEIPGAFVQESVFFISPDGALLKISATDSQRESILEHLPEFKSNADDQLKLKWLNQDSRLIIPRHLSKFASTTLLETGIELANATSFDVPFLAISFCHCLNIKINKEVLPQKVRAKRESRGDRLPIDSYSVIEIGPVKTALRDAAPDGESLQRRLHIMRGHFKNYKERGLFGKQRGVYWFPQQVRGNARLGKVKHDYKIIAET